MSKRDRPADVRVYHGLSGSQTAEAFLDAIRHPKCADFPKDENGISYWAPKETINGQQQVWCAWMLRLVAYELDRRNAPIEEELRRKAML